MTISQQLDLFYRKNNLPENGGENEDFFSLNFKYFSIKLPNSNFRKKVVYIHDIQHVLFQQDTTWKGEAYIAGWEIATKIWKHFPINIMSLWAMGFSFLIHRKDVIEGYKKGLQYHSLIGHNISKEAILSLSLKEVDQLLLKKTPAKFNRFVFGFWIFLALIIFSFPLLFVLVVWGII